MTTRRRRAWISSATAGSSAVLDTFRAGLASQSEEHKELFDCHRQEASAVLHSFRAEVDAQLADQLEALSALALRQAAQESAPGVTTVGSVCGVRSGVTTVGSVCGYAPPGPNAGDIADGAFGVAVQPLHRPDVLTELAECVLMKATTECVLTEATTECVLTEATTTTECVLPDLLTKLEEVALTEASQEVVSVSVKVDASALLDNRRETDRAQAAPSAPGLETAGGAPGECRRSARCVPGWCRCEAFCGANQYHLNTARGKRVGQRRASDSASAPAKLFGPTPVVKHGDLLAAQYTSDAQLAAANECGIEVSVGAGTTAAAVQLVISELARHYGGSAELGAQFAQREASEALRLCMQEATQDDIAVATAQLIALLEQPPADCNL